MPARLTIKDCQILAESKGGKFLSEKYINTIEKHLWECRYGHIWHASVKSIKKGNWCHFCSKRNRITTEICKELAKSRGFIFLDKEYVSYYHKHLWMCENGHKWRAKYNTIDQGSGCAKCSGKKKHTIEDCIDLANKNNGVFLSKIYTNSNEKHKWKCKNNHIFYARYNDISQGHWCAKCGREKARKTCEERYGVDNPMKNIEISLKSAKNSNNSCTFYHWKTGEEIICQASYEKRCVQYFNNNKIDFKWQPKIFIMPNGKTYRPDCYFPDRDLWVEIKGYKRGKGMKKWSWFQSEYPNSELWDKERLKHLNIL